MHCAFLRADNFRHDDDDNDDDYEDGQRMMVILMTMMTTIVIIFAGVQDTVMMMMMVIVVLLVQMFWRILRNRNTDRAHVRRETIKMMFECIQSFDKARHKAKSVSIFLRLLLLSSKGSPNKAPHDTLVPTMNHSSHLFQQGTTSHTRACTEAIYKSEHFSNLDSFAQRSLLLAWTLC